jgi:hypothetical protein
VIEKVLKITNPPANTAIRANTGSPSVRIVSLPPTPLTW